MTDRVHPSAKPGAPQNLNGAFTTKSQMYGATRPVYRPQPRRRRNRCCICCLWFTLLLLFIILVAAIAGAVIWVLYRPQRPSFSVTTLRFSSFNLTKDSHLISNLNFTLSARNPNKKLIYFYDPISVSVNSNGVDLGNGSFPSFVHPTKNTTLLHTTISSPRQALDSSSASTLSSDLKKNNVPLDIKLETKVKIKMGGFRSGKVKIRVHCDGISAAVSKGKIPSSSSSCKFKLREVVMEEFSETMKVYCCLLSYYLQV